jgi:hypothetical protein
MQKKQIAKRVATQRLTKAAAKKTIAARQQRSQFAAKVMGASKEVAKTSRAGELVDRTRAAKAARFLQQYRRVNAG